MPMRTFGQDIHFAAGADQPGSHAGDRLIAHEGDRRGADVAKVVCGVRIANTANGRLLHRSVRVLIGAASTASIAGSRPLNQSSLETCTRMSGGTVLPR